MPTVKLSYKTSYSSRECQMMDLTRSKNNKARPCQLTKTANQSSSSGNQVPFRLYPRFQSTKVHRMPWHLGRQLLLGQQSRFSSSVPFRGSFPITRYHFSINKTARKTSYKTSSTLSLQATLRTPPATSPNLLFAPRPQIPQSDLARPSLPWTKTRRELWKCPCPCLRRLGR